MDDIDPLVAAKSRLDQLDKERLQARRRYKKREIDQNEMFLVYQQWLDFLREYTQLKKNQGQSSSQ